jgi:hypothetical protein
MLNIPVATDKGYPKYLQFKYYRYRSYNCYINSDTSLDVSPSKIFCSNIRIGALEETHADSNYQDYMAAVVQFFQRCEFFIKSCEAVYFVDNRFVAVKGFEILEVNTDEIKISFSECVSKYKSSAPQLPREDILKKINEYIQKLEKYF